MPHAEAAERKARTRTETKRGVGEVVAGDVVIVVVVVDVVNDEVVVVVVILFLTKL